MTNEAALAGDSKSEVVVRLTSGLGNQLFQLAQGMALAERMNARLRYDTTWFGLVAGLHPVKRELKLPELSVPLPEAFRGPMRLIIGLLAAYFDKMGRGKWPLSIAGKMQVIQENTLYPDFNNDLGAIKGKRIYLNGYWQTSTPFVLVCDKLLPMLRPKSPLSMGAEALIAKANTGVTGFIHVRRGDYLHFMGAKGTLPVSYYSRAFTKMQAAGKRVAQWMIFAEDTDWARDNLSFISDAEIVDYPSPNRDIEDLIIMKTCSAGIIANSSFSWWGAALGNHPDRPIIGPDRYWQGSQTSTSAWTLPLWLRVKAWD
jgi:hypothetical protein